MIQLSKSSILRFLIAAVILFLIAGGSLLWAKSAKWSRTDPRINLTHIFEGEINKRGKPVGYHSRPGGMDAGNARVFAILEGPNNIGVYVATVKIRKSLTDKWHQKRSSFFPDHMDRQAVIRAVLNAYRNRSTGKSAKFRGPSGLGFTIEGWLLDSGGINTAYPIYR